MDKESHSTKFFGIFLDKGFIWNCLIYYVCSRVTNYVCFTQSFQVITTTSFFPTFHTGLSFGVAVQTIHFAIIFKLSIKIKCVINKLNCRTAQGDGTADSTLSLYLFMYLLKGKLHLYVIYTNT